MASYDYNKFGTSVGQMQYNATLRDGRRAALKLMTSTCVITRPGERVFNDEQGTYTDGVGEVIYSGRCRLKTVSPIGQRSGNTADREMTTVMYDLVLPWDGDAHGVSPSDHVVVDSSGPTYQVQNVDRSKDRTATHVIMVDQDRGSVDWA